MRRMRAAVGAAVVVLGAAVPAHGYFQDRIANEAHAVFTGDVGLRGMATLTADRSGAMRGRLSLLGAAVDTSPIRLVATDATCDTARFPEDFAPAGPGLAVAADGVVAGEWEHERGAALTRRARSLGVVAGEGAAAVLVACAAAQAYAADPAPDERSVLVTSAARLAGDGPVLLAAAASSALGAATAATVLARLEPTAAYAFGTSARSCTELAAGGAVEEGALHEVTTDAQGAAFVTGPTWASSPEARSMVVLGPGAGPHVQACAPVQHVWARARR